MWEVHCPTNLLRLASPLSVGRTRLSRCVNVWKWHVWAVCHRPQFPLARHAPASFQSPSQPRRKTLPVFCVVSGNFFWQHQKGLRRVPLLACPAVLSSNVSERLFQVKLREPKYGYPTRWIIRLGRPEILARHRCGSGTVRLGQSEVFARHSVTTSGSTQDAF